ncbi:MAG: M3 family oligoendopeptidase [Deltaproteobacteria bacterium]|nr:M3 family oligoendopeptidase [Deltaproteobacteria bacterium]
MEPEMNWDLSSYFPEFGGPEMQSFKDELKRDIASLRGKSASLPSLNPQSQSEWVNVFLRHEEIIKRLSHLSSYIGCLASADSRNEAHLKEEAALALLRAEMAKVRVELLRAVKEISDELFTGFIAQKEFEGARYYLQRVREDSQRTMSPEKEILAADLNVDGIQAWGRLYDRVSSNLEFEMEYPDGRRQRIAMAQRRTFMEDADRRVRRAAFEAGNAAWKQVEDMAAAALNAISGTRLSLNRHRGIDHFLDVALFQAGITRKGLDAMFEAVYAEIELPRRILRLKAGAMNSRGIAWYDLGAPLALPDQRRLSWEDGKALVNESFSRAYPALGHFFQEAVDKSWVEWSPRAGKRPGAFCTGSQLIQESRIFMTYNGALGDVLTLAHESGHAFHSRVMRDIRPYARVYPMTLAESASTFGELILIEGVLQDPSLTDVQRAFLLDIEIGHAAVYLLDISARYEFEKSLYEERAAGDLAVSRLKELMVATQRRIFGDVLEEGGEDPYFWASKLHFYITGITFYNFTYTFGFLLSRGLFERFKQEGEDFLPRYEQFLRLSGSDSAINVVRKAIGADLETPEFWVEAIRSLDQPLAELENLLPAALAASQNLRTASA